MNIFGVKKARLNIKNGFSSDAKAPFRLMKSESVFSPPNQTRNRIKG